MNASPNPYRMFMACKSHYQVIDGSEMKSFNCSFPHTIHCLASGEIMISTMGDKDENGKGDFILIDAKTLKMKGKREFLDICLWRALALKDRLNINVYTF